MTKKYQGITSGWVKEHFGISQGKLEEYNKIVQPGTMEGQEYNRNKYLKYTEEDIQKIWCLHMLSEMGCKMAEIKKLIFTEWDSFRDIITEKIGMLEAEKQRIETMLGIARMCQLTGRIPTPKKPLETNFMDYRDSVVKGWNANKDKETRLCSRAVEYLTLHPTELSNSEEFVTFIEYVFERNIDDISEVEVEKLLKSIMPENMEDSMNVSRQWDILIDMRKESVSSEKVQNQIMSIYKSTIKVLEGNDFVTPIWFAERKLSELTDGDCGIYYKNKYGQESLDFLIKALEYFIYSANAKLEQTSL